MAETSTVGPVAEARRIEVLDVLRGVAVLGILVTNIQHFSMFAGTVRNPSLYGNLEGANLAVWVLTYTFVLQKFLPIFSMLFGAGIALAAERFEASGTKPAAVHYRRMAVLLLIGLAHAYLIWYGDILFVYAVCGMVVYGFRRLPSNVLIALGVAVLAVHTLIQVSLLVSPLGGGDVSAVSVEQVVADDLAAYRGDWLRQLPMRARYAFEVQTLGLAFILFWKSAGLMLIGMALYKLGFITGRRSRTLYATVVGISLAVALPVTVLGLSLNLATGWENAVVLWFSNQIVYWFGAVMSLAWIGIVVLACRGGCRFPLAQAIRAVGRTSLTCYLAQSQICTFIFYGHGLGLYGSVERTGQIAIVVGVWVLLLALAPIWLNFFSHGPAEWLWRSLAYGRVQPLRRSG